VSSDKAFLKKVVRAANPLKFQKDADFLEHRLTLKDFLVLFRQDTLGDKLVECLRALAVNSDVNKKVASTHTVTVAQMQAAIKHVWYQLASREKELDPSNLTVSNVTAMLAFEWKIADQPNCMKYLRSVAYTDLPKTVDGQDSLLKIEWEDFNALFCRNIFKYSMVAATRNLLESGSVETAPNLLIKLLMSRMQHLWTNVVK
jgi:hypothetical protein